MTPDAKRKNETTFGSDVVIDALSRMGIQYMSINPSATLRGLHDSVVNTELGSRVSMVLCCHEEIAVAVAHGYAKASGRPMAVAVGNIVGLQHASMAIYNAFSDRVPMLVLSGAGPLDASSRRPHVDWVHATIDQGRIVEQVVKWGDQPLSVPAMVHSLTRGHRIAITKPMGPVHIALDTALQEAPAELWSDSMPDESAGASRISASEKDIARVVGSLATAARPVIMIGRIEGSSAEMVELAETLHAPVIDVGQRTGMPAGHELDLSDCREEILRDCDLILALEVKDLYGRLRTHPDPVTRKNSFLPKPGTTIIRVGLDETITSGFGQFQYQPTELELITEPESALEQIADALAKHPDRDDWHRRATWWEGVRSNAVAAWSSEMEREWDSSPVSPGRLAYELGVALDGRPIVLAHNQMGNWPKRLWDWDKPMRFLGLLQFAAVALGYGPGVATGAGLAAKETGETVVCIDGDGDFLYTPSALWTAAHLKVPVLFVVLSNGAYGVDIAHQAAIARARGRSTQNPAKGLELIDPRIQFTELANAYGVYSDEAVEQPDKLDGALSRALAHIDGGNGPALVEVITKP